MKKPFVRVLSLALLTVLIISMALSGCGNKTDSPVAPVAPPAQDGQNTPNNSEVQDGNSTPNTPTAPDGQPVTPPGATTEETSFVKNGKVYITDCVFIGLEGTIDGYGWTSWTGRTNLVAKELIEYKSSDDVKESSIAQALDRAFKPVITSHPDCEDGYTIYNLKNNDIVTWTYEVDEDMFKKLKSYVKGIEFVVTDGEMTVDRLVEAVEVNPFENQSVFGIDYYDNEDNERVWIISITNLCDNFGVELDVEIDSMGHTGEWKNGDQFKVKILTSAEQLKEYGYIFTQTEGTITITWM